MNKRDILELRRRLKKDSCTINRVTGCYVDMNKNKVVKLSESFLNLPDEEFYKYLEIAKKTLSGTIGNNILELDFTSEEESGGKQQFFMGLRASELKDEGLLDRLYDLIIENYDSTGNYLILVFHDAYDIITRTTDNLKLDESEEVYEYLLTAICPVELAKPGLSYRQDENRIGARIRDWVVSAPQVGFLFPAFSEGGADIHKVAYFLKDAKESHVEFIEEVIGCGPKRTATQQRKTFAAIVKQVYSENEEKGEEVLTDIEESLMLRSIGEDGEELAISAIETLSERVIDDILAQNEVEENKATQIKKVVLEEFADEAPLITSLVDEKELDKKLKERQTKELVKEVSSLRAQLKEKEELTQESNADATNSTVEPDMSDSTLEAGEADVILSVKPEKAELIKSQFIDGERYILIPIDEDEQLKINGIDRKF